MAKEGSLGTEGEFSMEENSLYSSREKGGNGAGTGAGAGKSPQTPPPPLPALPAAVCWALLSAVAGAGLPLSAGHCRAGWRGHPDPSVGVTCVQCPPCPPCPLCPLCPLCPPQPARSRLLSFGMVTPSLSPGWGTCPAPAVSRALAWGVTLALPQCGTRVQCPPCPSQLAWSRLSWLGGHPGPSAVCDTCPTSTLSTLSIQPAWSSPLR